MTHLAGPDLGQAVMGSRRHQTPWPRDAQVGGWGKGPRDEKEWGQEERRGGNGTAGREGPRLKGEPSSTCHGRVSRRDASMPTDLWASAPQGALSPWPEPAGEGRAPHCVTPPIWFFANKETEGQRRKAGLSPGPGGVTGQRHTGGKAGA